MAPKFTEKNYKCFFEIRICFAIDYDLKTEGLRKRH